MKKVSILTFFLLSFGYVLAQNIETEIDPSTIPLDGGIVTITLMAVAYGVKRHKENKDNKSL